MTTPTIRHPDPAITGDGSQNPTPAPPIAMGSGMEPGAFDHDAADGLPVIAHVPDMGLQVGTSQQTETEIFEVAAEPGTSQETLDQGGQLDRIEGHLAAIRWLLTKAYDQPDEDVWATLTASRETVLYRRARRYLCVWTPTALTGLTFSVMGQSATLNLVAGWNNLSLPDGATLTLGTGATAQLVLVRVTNWNYGAAI